MSDAIKLAIDFLHCVDQRFDLAKEPHAPGVTMLDQFHAALAALRAQPDHSYEFPSAPKHHDLIAELRRPMHYLSMAKRNRAADALEGKQ